MSATAPCRADPLLSAFVIEPTVSGGICTVEGRWRMTGEVFFRREVADRDFAAVAGALVAGTLAAVKGLQPSMPGYDGAGI